MRLQQAVPAGSLQGKIVFIDEVMSRTQDGSGYGVAVASYLGHKTAQRILRANDAATAYDDLPFETRPFYRGNPWFLPATLLWYRWLDATKR